MSGRFAKILYSVNGFTFLEVMAALAIMVIALVPVLQNQALNVKTTTRAYMTTQATLLAASKLAVYSAIGYPEQRKESGKFDQIDYASFSYEYSQNDTGFPGVQRNILVVRWGEKMDEMVEITTYAVQTKKK